MEIDIFRQYISTFPEVDSPEIFGLHPNADMTYRMKEVKELLDTLLETQPKTSSVVVVKPERWLLKKLKNYWKNCLLVMCLTFIQVKSEAGGLDVPLNVFCSRSTTFTDRYTNCTRYSDYAGYPR